MAPNSTGTSFTQYKPLVRRKPGFEPLHVLPQLGELRPVALQANRVHIDYCVGQTLTGAVSIGQGLCDCQTPLGRL